VGAKAQDEWPPASTRPLSVGRCPNYVHPEEKCHCLSALLRRNQGEKGHQLSARRIKMHDLVTLINYFLVQLQGKRTLAETQTHCHTRSCKRVLFFSKINGTFTENKRAFEQ
jgi:hypothetical protein